MFKGIKSFNYYMKTERGIYEENIDCNRYAKRFY